MKITSWSAAACSPVTTRMETVTKLWRRNPTACFFLCDVPKLSYNSWESRSRKSSQLNGNFSLLAPSTMQREKKWWLWRLNHLPLYLQCPFSYLKLHFPKWGLVFNCIDIAGSYDIRLLLFLWLMCTCSLALCNIGEWLGANELLWLEKKTISTFTPD